jgi:hypothetical protein
MSDFSKEIIERYLLQSMKELDNAVHNISQLNHEHYQSEINKLIECKRDIKKILQKSFDTLARKKIEFGDSPFNPLTDSKGKFTNPDLNF